MWNVRVIKSNVLSSSSFDTFDSSMVEVSFVVSQSGNASSRLLVGRPRRAPLPLLKVEKILKKIYLIKFLEEKGVHDLSYNYVDVYLILIASRK